MNKILRYILGTLGILLLVANLPLALMSLAQTFQDSEDRAIGIGVTLFFAACAFCGYLLVRHNFWLARRNNSRARQDATVQTILELARDHGGKLTVYDAALHPDITTDDAKKGLEALVKDGLAYNYVTPEGTMLYMFGDTKPLSNYNTDVDDEF
ncbi:MAG: hypothetical protein AAF708_12315 [Deinococcota bacterium]